MKVILLKDIKGTGKKGDIINASDGHARNYLIPRKFAIEATQNNLREINFKKANDKKRKKDDLESAQLFAKEISQIELKIEVTSGEGNKLFGSITSKNIADELKENHNIDIDKKKILLKSSIKELGEYDVEIKIYPNVKAILKVKIISK